jgi:acetyl esterase/lipase
MQHSAGAAMRFFSFSGFRLRARHIARHIQKYASAGIAGGAAIALFFLAPTLIHQRKDVAYGPHPRHRLDLCAPVLHSARTPAVLLIHGGGWVGGEKDGLAELCHYFAEKGILAASVEYRLADGRNENRWPAQLVDVQLAVRWLRTNAYELGIDPYHICAYGNSAGGHLATWLLIEQSIRPGDYAGELQAVSPEISCAITNSGPVDFSMLPPSFDSVLSLLAPLECKGSRECTVAELSPLASINKTLASPLLISHGRHDELVPIEQATKLLAALEHFHSAVSFINYDGAHEFLETSSSVQRKVLALQLDFIKHGNAR